MEKIICRIDDVPDDTGVGSYVYKKYIKDKFDKIPYRLKFDKIIKFRIADFDLDKSLQSINEAGDLYGWWGFMAHFADPNVGRDDYYGGFSITYNPELYYDVPESAATLGEPKINLHGFFTTSLGMRVWPELEDKKLTPMFATACATKGLAGAKEVLLNYKLITETEANEYDWNKSFTAGKRQNKNGYYDGWGFRYLTSAAKHGYHGDFLQNRCKRTLIRSRVAYIDGSKYTPNAADYQWHCDEPILMNLRINIPITTTSNYEFEIKDSYVGKLEAGYGYAWNTEVLHRVYATGYEDTKRINIVLGNSPWFDYDHEQRAYISNEFFGEMHPFDMLAEGHVISGIEMC